MQKSNLSLLRSTSLEKGRLAFTLVELIVVITILAILWTIAFISLQWYSRDARDSTRTADLWNIKTSLELYTLKTWKYPKPDNFSTISYSWWIVWYQWKVWDQVTTNLKSLNEKPLDPLLNTPYIYSVTNTYKEYEVLALYEWSVAYNPIINSANAATTQLTPKVVWNYNWVFLKTSNYIIPTPSIITSESWDITLDLTTIKSQVITNGINIPKNIINSAKTWSLNMILSVYTWSINKKSTNREKITIMKFIQKVYKTSNITLPILDNKWNKDLLSFANNTIREKPTKFWDWRDIDPICDIPDIVIWTQIWAWCNSTVWNWTEWGKADDWNDWTIVYCNKSHTWLNILSDCIIDSEAMDSNSKENTWFTWSTNLWDRAVNNIWWKFYSWWTANTACKWWYHLPNDWEFSTLEQTLWCPISDNSVGWWWRCLWNWWRYHSTTYSGTSIAEVLKLPLSGIRSNISNDYVGRWITTVLRSATYPYVREIHIIYSTVSRAPYWNNYRTSVRCIKD